jgi:cell division transport system ATP-binding protein
MIEFDKVTKTFPTGITVLQDISFTIEPGELVAITGPSGAGKTTLLRLLIREILPTKGTIKVDKLNLGNLRAKELPKLRRVIGPVFQDFKLLEDRSAAENVALILEILGKDYEEAFKLAEKLLKHVKLQGKENLFPRQLSGGELQRVAIARALATRPKILFADEPTGNLDTKTSQGIIKLLHEINDSGTTVIIATHNDRVLDALDTRVIELELNDGAEKPAEESQNESPESTDH